METQAKVVFRNVGQMYFPETRVECHYSLTPEHHWSSSDWIGLFQAGWSSVKEYCTYTWALVPEGYTEGASVNCCALFQAFYLPCRSAVEYQFVYVDERGEECARSRSFTFCAPKPLEELETVKEERGEDEEDEEEELLLVIPKAQLLQSELEKMCKEQAGVKLELEKAQREKEMEMIKHEEAQREWTRERGAMKEEIWQLREDVSQSREKLKMMAGKHKDVKETRQNLSSELSQLLTERAESQQRIKELEDDVKLLTDSGKEVNATLERVKERVKKMSDRMKYEEEKRKSLQGENQAALAEVRGLQEHLEASEHVVKNLRRELAELGNQQGNTQGDLHQARLQAARLTLQLSEQNLAFKEAQANWALEREAYKHSAQNDVKKLHQLSSEVQRKEEWLQEERMEREKLETELGREKDCHRVLCGEANRELQELRTRVRNALREGEQLQAEKQDLKNYIHQLEQRLGLVSHDDCLNSQSHCEVESPSEAQGNRDTAIAETKNEKDQNQESEAGEGLR